MSGTTVQDELTTTAATIFTASGVVAQVIAADVTEKAGAGQTGTVHVVKSGGAIADADTFTFAFAVTSGGVAQLTTLLSHLLLPGDTIQMLASANTAVNAKISVVYLP